MNELNQPGWIVMKFGGTSVSSSDCWRTIYSQARQQAESGRRVMIVVSALSGVTNLLTQVADGQEESERKRIALELEQRHFSLLEALQLQPPGRFLGIWQELQELLGQCGQQPLGDRERAYLLSRGEYLSSAIGEAVLTRADLDVQWNDARELLSTRQEGPLDFLSARAADQPRPDQASALAKEATVHITQGFIAGGPKGESCLLGRGGSDSSAACLAAQLSADELQIWTDVPGVFSADPRLVPDARLLRRLSYSEAQELASMGAKILHPPSVQPARGQDIPILIKDTHRPEESGTCIAARRESEEAQVKGVVSRSDITLVSMETPAMWQQAGFLADAFAVFKRHGYSVDLISTSESTVTVTLDPQAPASGDRARRERFLADLQKLCRVRIREGCVSISLVGNAIRTILGRLSVALDVFQDRRVHMVTQSANDLNLTLVVDAEHATSLVRKMHQLLIGAEAANRPEFGPSWTDLTHKKQVVNIPDPWWVGRSASLMKLMDGRENAYVYDLETLRAAARRVAGLRSVERALYAVKANDHPEILRTLFAEGMKFECVSMSEVHHVLESVPGAGVQDILFTPNFAPRQEYRSALELGVRVTVDNAWAIQQWPEDFAGQDIFLRLDLDAGYGHNKKVITSGADSKFGISLEHLEQVRSQLAAVGARVVGLHSHTGSGVANADAWREQLLRFIDVLPGFNDVRYLDLGGGFSVPDRRGRAALDMPSLDAVLDETLGALDVELWLEPGRYLVSEAGVLLSRVTQLKKKGSYHYLGINTGMNALIRPALYGAYHDIANLQRLAEEPGEYYRIVGPICESGDVIGEGRLLPPSEEGDVILIANAGAYGRVMASMYNRRDLPEELFI